MNRSSLLWCCSLLLVGCGGATASTSTTSGSQAAEGPSPAIGTGSGTCESPRIAAFGQTVRGDTRAGAANNLEGSCGGSDGRDFVYLLHASQAVQITARLEASFDGVLYLQSQCGDTTSELQCNDDAEEEDTTHSFLTARVDPGDYYLVVDSFAAAGQGIYDLTITTQPAAPLAQLCGEAPALVPGHVLTGTTTNRVASFTAQCGGEAPGPDAVHSLTITEPSRVRLRQESLDFDGVLYVRSDCASASSETYCNDDFGDEQHSVVTALMQPGRYFVYTDGFNASSAGTYSLQADVVPLSGTNAAGDVCASATPLAVDAPTQIDTFASHDDYAGSCGGQGSPDAVATFTLATRSLVQVDLGGGDRTDPGSAVFYLRRSCDEAGANAEVACNVLVPAEEASTATMSAVLDAGSYFLVADGRDNESFGARAVTLHARDLAPVEAACHAAPLLRPGLPIHGTTDGATDNFKPSCVAGGLDRVYHFQLRQAQEVRITLESAFDASLSLRSECVQPTSEIMCNDDFNDAQHSAVEAALGPGSYFVNVDGFDSTNSGAFTLSMQTGPIGTRLGPEADASEMNEME